VSSLNIPAYSQTRVLSSASPWHLFCLSMLYLAQGLPNGFLGLALPTYLATQGASVADIGLLLSITMLPWTIKFLYGPFVDSFSLLKFGRRRFWILLSQSLMIISLVPLVVIGVDNLSITNLVIILVIHNIFMAFQDISTDALAADSLPEKALSKGNGIMWGSKVFGKGLGMAIATSIYFTYGTTLGISVLMILIALIMLVPMFSKELNYKVGLEKEVYEVAKKLNVKELLTGIFNGFNSSRVFFAIIFICFANLSMGVYEVLYNKFYIDELNWTGQMIGDARPWGFWIGGLVGLGAGLLGSFISHTILLRIFIFCELILFFLLSTYSAFFSQTLGYIILLGIEVFDAGMTVLLFAILMSLCTTKTSATNFGIFMAISNMSLFAGDIIAAPILILVDYSGAFLFCGISLIPCFYLASRLEIKRG
jgi:MFS transporter, PAT family, beta-lactamase induction signal transducer AmpG